MIRILMIAPPWIAIGPAFWMHWLPWWYVFPLAVGFALAENAAENIGRRHRS